MSSSSSSSDGGPPLPNTIVLDACVLLNLFAAGRVEEILRSLSSRCLVSGYARREALWYLVLVDQAGGTMERREIELEPLIAAGLVEILDLTQEEQDTFVELAQELGDGEAASGALAIGRSAAVATDDAKARKVFARRIPPLSVVGTVALLRSWEARAAVSRTDIAATLQAIRLGARYYPRGDDDDAAWWRARTREISLH
jgi:predicted nucleic acid-binding protein